jgi:glycosyltransferase involved in cell wall biosynthesis
MGLRNLVDTLAGYRMLLGHELHGRLAAARRAPRGKGRHLLLLAPFLPPCDNGGVHRPLSWLRYAERNGWQVHALTHPHAHAVSAAGRYLQAQLPTKADVRVTRPASLRPSWRWFPRTDGDFLSALESVRLAQEIVDEHDVGVVAATGPSFDLFVTALYVARRHRLPLVLDYRDEWTENPFNFIVRGNADRYWERRCLAAADLVLFTTESMRRHAQQVFPGLDERRCAVLHNGWEPGDSRDAPGRVRDPAGRLRIVFAGAMGTWTPPGPFLADVLAVLQEAPEWQGRLQLEFIGTRGRAAQDEIDRFPIPGVVTSGSVVPKDVADAKVRASDAALLLMSPEFERYLPGKLFDYLAAGVPVLVHGADCEAARLVTQLNAGVFVPAGDAGALAQAMRRLADAPSATWNSDARRRFVADHTREALAARFFGLLDGLAS